MGRNVKVLIGLVLVLALAVVGYVATKSYLVGGGIVVVGILAGIVILRRTAEFENRPARKSNEFLEPSGAAPAPTAEPLATWTPPTSFSATPTLDGDTTFGSDTAEAEPDFEVSADNVWADEDWHDSAWDDAAVSLEENPLDELDRLDDVDVVAEVERLEQREAGLGTDVEALDDRDDVGLADTITAGDTTVVEVDFEKHEVNEEVESADDIMAASRATELAAEPDNSELARLLAKVQARLATYE